MFVVLVLDEHELIRHIRGVGELTTSGYRRAALKGCLTIEGRRALALLDLTGYAHPAIHCRGKLVRQQQLRRLVVAHSALPRAQLRGFTCADARH